MGQKKLRFFRGAFHTSPETADQSTGRDQVIPVAEGYNAAKQNSTDHQDMLINGKKGSFL